MLLCFFAFPKGKPWFDISRALHVGTKLRHAALHALTTLIFILPAEDWRRVKQTMKAEIKGKAKPVITLLHILYSIRSGLSSQWSCCRTGTWCWRHQWPLGNVEFPGEGVEFPGERVEFPGERVKSASLSCLGRGTLAMSHSCLWWSGVWLIVS